ncbi:HlyD family type I secretion periplasmic adaptor subunit [Parahaliea aestuarii]|uniref:Membrane fusion protein (MFP) family protein n=1 Tax=Parahaliea aestuarii TaxID=1852021 RepID=A0A5C8ZQE0_9GAMM|nr:HlyD family type I secretion periplasmic adaptor subunit [Parahaliea aestuarii]TXS89949.1 HlyD family type I secretion periplasmic adaptor subunit [Parahaliea aestuarii]
MNDLSKLPLDQPAPEKKKRSLADLLFGPWLKDPDDVPRNWQQDAHNAFLSQQPLRARALLYFLAVTVIVLVAWSALAEIDEVTRGQGKVIPSRKVQVIQSQDGGVVTEILVKEGGIVEQGQLLVRLDQTRSESSLRESMAELRAMRVKAARLRAAVRGEDFTPLAEWQEMVPEIVLEELALFESGKAKLAVQKEIASEQLLQRQEELSEVTARSRQLGRSLELARQELGVTRPMVQSGAVSQVEILRLEREVNRLGGEYEQAQAQVKRIRSAITEAERKLLEVEIEFANESRTELTETLARINGLEAANTGLSDRVQQTEVRSPVKGTVKQLYFNTIGGVVLPGKEIVEVVPLDDTLLLEVRIRPKDIAFLVPGQKALVKFTAYDFVVYGGLEGVVEHIGADTIMDEEGNPFYEINVRTEETSLGENLPIIPGMTVETDILTGKKSILAYLMKPVLRAKQYALTER